MKNYKINIDIDFMLLKTIIMLRRISSRELEVLQLISLEHSMKEIASALCISTETVKTHRKNIYRKLDATNAAGVVRRAFEKGLLQLNIQQY